MKIILKIFLLVLLILLLNSFFSFASVKKEGGLFITKNGDAFNGNFEDKFIKILTHSGEISLSSSEITSIYRDTSETVRIKQHKEILRGKIIDNIKVKTLQGIVNIIPEDIIFFHSTSALLDKSIANIAWIDIIEDYAVEVLTLNKPSDGTDITIVPEYWAGESFMISNPNYAKIINSTEPTTFTLDILKLAPIVDKSIVIFRLRIEMKDEMGKTKGSFVREMYNYDITPASVPLGESKKVNLNLTFEYPGLGRSESLEGSGYLDIFVVSDLEKLSKALLNKHVYIYKTISNVLRVPIEFRKK